MRYLLATLLIVALSACMAPRVDNGQTQNFRRNYFCEKTRVTGSNRIVKVCRSRAQMEREQEEAQEFMRRNVPQVSGPG
ncbi:MAG: hypothetical protein KDI19_13015 [Pseudomonadales bacterium]|nr:hypothetical protein [Pseudomonadales bacterium]